MRENLTVEINAIPDRKRWKSDLARYLAPDPRRSLGQIASVVLPYLGVWAAGALTILVDSTLQDVPLTAFQALGDSASMIGGVGPGLGFAGPMGSYEPFSDFSKLVMALLMWVGRLEVLPVLVLLTRGYWRV